MPTPCTHILPSGQKCNAPALNGGSLCRHHRPRKRSDRSLPIESAPFVLPVFEDSRGLLRAVTDVLNAMSERRIKRSEGGTFLFGLQIASRLISDLASGCPPTGACFDSPSDLRRPAEEEFSREPRQESFAGDPQNFHEPTIEEAEQFLAAMQSSTVEQALDEWEAKQTARARERAQAARQSAKTVEQQGREQKPLGAEHQREQTASAL